MMKPRLCVDYDGTLVEHAWPTHGEWMPGAVAALRELKELYTVVVYTSRVAPLWTDEVTKRSEAAVQMEYNEIRRRLDEEGLREIQIHDFRVKPWKPRGVYVDDNAIHFAGRKDSWKNITIKLRAIHEKETGVLADLLKISMEDNDTLR